MSIVKTLRKKAAGEIKDERFWVAIEEDHCSFIGYHIQQYSDADDRISLWWKPEAIRMALLFVAEAIEQETT